MFTISFLKRRWDNRAVRKRWRIVIVAAFLVVLAAIVVHLNYNQDKEPSYHGHPLSYWIHVYHQTPIGFAYPIRSHAKIAPDRLDAENAVLAMGTNSLPCLLKWLEYQPSGLRIRLSKMRFAGGVRWIPMWATDEPSIERRIEAEDGLKILGTSAQAAVPRLASLARSHDPDKYYRAWHLLSSLGCSANPGLLAVMADTNAVTGIRAGATQKFGWNASGISDQDRARTNYSAAVPVLIQNLDGPDPNLAFTSANAIGAIASSAMHLRPVIAVPHLRAALARTNSIVRSSAAYALGAFGSDARAALPDLLIALNDSDSDVRLCASNSVMRIAPEDFGRTSAR